MINKFYLMIFKFEFNFFYIIEILLDRNHNCFYFNFKYFLIVVCIYSNPKILFINNYYRKYQISRNYNCFLYSILSFIS